MPSVASQLQDEIVERLEAQAQIADNSIPILAERRANLGQMIQAAINRTGLTAVVQTLISGAVDTQATNPYFRIQIQIDITEATEVNKTGIGADELAEIILYALNMWSPATLSGNVITLDTPGLVPVDLGDLSNRFRGYTLTFYGHGGLDRAGETTATPSISDATLDVVITCADSGATIIYTTDGTVPSLVNGTAYTAPFTLASGTVKARAWYPGKRGSAVASATVTAPGSGGSVPAYQTLTRAATTTFNVSSGTHAFLLLDGNITTFNFSNTANGGVHRLIVRQDATGSRTIGTWTDVTWIGGTAPTLDATGNAYTQLIFWRANDTIFGQQILPGLLSGDITTTIAGVATIARINGQITGHNDLGDTLSGDITVDLNVADYHYGTYIGAITGLTVINAPTRFAIRVKLTIGTGGPFAVALGPDRIPTGLTIDPGAAEGDYMELWIASDNGGTTLAIAQIGGTSFVTP